jgi:hypothetical protein
MMLAVVAALAASCVPEPPKMAPAVGPLGPVSAPVAANNQDDWNIFPDPVTGRVEIYNNGEYVGSVIGDEPEDPPIPRRRE